MENPLLLVVALVMILGMIPAVAYWLERRSRKKKPIGGLALPPVGPWGRRLLWPIRILQFLMVVTVVIVLAFGRVWVVWVTAAFLALWIVLSWIYRIVRLSGK